MIDRVAAPVVGKGRGRAAGTLRQPQRHVGGVVAVLGVLGTFDEDVVGDVDRELATVDGGGHGGPDDVAQLLRCHRTSVLTATARPGAVPGARSNWCR